MPKLIDTDDDIQIISTKLNDSDSSFSTASNSRTASPPPLIPMCDEESSGFFPDSQEEMVWENSSTASIPGYQEAYFNDRLSERQSIPMYSIGLAPVHKTFTLGRRASPPPLHPVDQLPQSFQKPSRPKTVFQAAAATMNMKNLINLYGSDNLDFSEFTNSCDESTDSWDHSSTGSDTDYQNKIYQNNSRYFLHRS